jgi:transaldolase
MFRERLQRPNILVKVPATAEGIPAIEELIYEGININITLIFAIDRYREVIEAYLKGLERRLAEGKPIDDIWSVASFFVSRVDTNVDKKLDALIAKAGSEDEKTKLKALKGKAAIANAKIAYEVFQEIFGSERWQKLAAAGAHVQRPLWASTSTKDPTLPDTLYVDQLIGPDTVNTLPEPTIDAFEDHGTVARTIDENSEAAAAVLARAADLGVDLADVGHTLEDQGVAAFDRSYADVLARLQAKVAAHA